MDGSILGITVLFLDLVVNQQLMKNFILTFCLKKNIFDINFVADAKICE